MQPGRGPKNPFGWARAINPSSLGWKPASRPPANSIGLLQSSAGARFSVGSFFNFSCEMNRFGGRGACGGSSALIRHPKVTWPSLAKGGREKSDGLQNARPLHRAAHALQARRPRRCAQPLLCGAAGKGRRTIREPGSENSSESTNHLLQG